jgi:hypothetical protein
MLNSITGLTALPEVKNRLLLFFFSDFRLTHDVIIIVMVISQARRLCKSAQRTAYPKPAIIINIPMIRNPFIKRMLP